MMVLVLTQGCLKTPSMIALLYQAALIEACLVPVLAEDSFRFPSAESFEELHREVTRARWRGGGAGRVRAELAAWSWPRGVSWSSARIAPLFEPLSSAALLEAQAPSRSRKEDQGLSDPSDPSRRRRTTGTPG